jgi:hypothetical protein
MRALQVSKNQAMIARLWQMCTISVYFQIQVYTVYNIVLHTCLQYYVTVEQQGNPPANKKKQRVLQRTHHPLFKCPSSEGPQKLPAPIPVITISAGQPSSHQSSLGLPVPTWVLVIIFGSCRCRVGRVSTVFAMP